MKAIISTIKRGKHAGEFKFTLYGKNGEPVAQSYPESYTTKQNCKKTLKNCFPGFTITGVGSHGVNREAKDGEQVNFNAEGDKSPDAIAKKITEELIASVASIDSAKLIHWPGQECEIVDDLVTGKRKGNF